MHACGTRERWVKALSSHIVTENSNLLRCCSYKFSCFYLNIKLINSRTTTVYYEETPQVCMLCWNSYTFQKEADIIPQTVSISYPSNICGMLKKWKTKGFYWNQIINPTHREWWIGWWSQKSNLFSFHNWFCCTVQYHYNAVSFLKKYPL